MFGLIPQREFESLSLRHTKKAPNRVPFLLWRRESLMRALPHKVGREFGFAARRSGCLHTRRRARVFSPQANTWVAAPKRVRFLFEPLSAIQTRFLRSAQNPVRFCRAERVELARKRQACKFSPQANTWVAREYTLALRVMIYKALP